MCRESRTLFAAVSALASLAVAPLASCAPTERAELLLQASGAGDVADQAMEEARAIVERRLGSAGVEAPSVTREGRSRILVRLAHPEDAERVKSLVRARGRLEFKLVDESASMEQLESGQAPLGSRIYASREGRIALRQRTIVTGAMLQGAHQAFDQQTGEPVVVLTFDSTGARRFARATQENVGRRFAIVVDDRVLSAPVINEPILGGSAQITGSFTMESASDLANMLRSGTLPVDLAVAVERVVER